MTSVAARRHSMCRAGDPDHGGTRLELGHGLGIQFWSDTELFLDLLLDPVRQVGVVAQEVARVLLALAQLIAFAGVPGAGLVHDPLLHPEVDQAALAADPGAKENVELGRLEWRRELVLHDSYPGTVAHRVWAA